MKKHKFFSQLGQKPGLPHTHKMQQLTQHSIKRKYKNNCYNFKYDRYQDYSVKFIEERVLVSPRKNNQKNQNFLIISSLFPYLIRIYLILRTNKKILLFFKSGFRARRKNANFSHSEPLDDRFPTH